MDTSSGNISTVVIDKDGDAILTLKNPIEKLKEWIEEASNNNSSDTPGSGPDDEVAGGINGRSNVSLESTSNITKATHEYRFQVSSALLRNASEYFRNMFCRGFSETMINAEDGNYHITVQELHPKALEHVMNIIHVRTKCVPRQITMELLVHIAILVDYYSMEDAVAFHTEIWAKAVARKKFPVKYGKDLLLRTFIAKNFGDKKSYQRGAELILRGCNGPIQDLGVPMFGLTDMLDERRSELIKTMVDKVKTLPQDIKIGKWGCGDACKAMLLGNFVLKYSDIKFSGQRLGTIRYPFCGVSYNSICLQLQLCSFPPDWSSYEGVDDRVRKHTCNLNNFVESVIRAGQEALNRDFEA